MRIGILSDTHLRVDLAKETLDFLLKREAEFIIHAGDIQKVETLELLAACGRRYIAVYGNNDANLLAYNEAYNLVQEPYYFKLADTKFKLMHLPFYMSNDAEVVIFGHTHQFEVAFQGGSLYLNPGEVCARNKPISECAILEVKSNKFRVEYYTKKAQEPFMLQKEYEFQREKK